MRKVFFENELLTKTEDLNLEQVLILWYILSFTTNGKKCGASLKQFMKLTRVGNARTIIKYLKDLEDKGYIIKENRIGSTTLYNITEKVEKIYGGGSGSSANGGSVESNTSVETNRGGSGSSANGSSGGSGSSANGGSGSSANGVLAVVPMVHTSNTYKNNIKKELNKKDNSSMGVNPQATEGFPHIEPVYHRKHRNPNMDEEDERLFQERLNKIKKYNYQ